MPIEWEIKRAREMIGELKPEIQRNAEIVAREEVAVKRLNEEIGSKETLLAKGRNDILRLKGDLESASQSGSVHFTYAGRKYSETKFAKICRIASSNSKFTSRRPISSSKSCQLASATWTRRVASWKACWQPNVNWKSKSKISKRV